MEAAVVAKRAALPESPRAARMTPAEDLVEGPIPERDRMAAFDSLPGDCLPLLDRDRPRREAVVRSADAIARRARHGRRDDQCRDKHDAADSPRSSRSRKHLTLLGFGPS